MSVNFSPIQFYRDDFIEKVKSTLKRYEIQPGELTAEITENVLVHDTQRITELLEQLRELVSMSPLMTLAVASPASGI